MITVQFCRKDGLNKRPKNRFHQIACPFYFDQMTSISRSLKTEKINSLRKCDIIWFCSSGFYNFNYFNHNESYQNCSKIIIKHSKNVILAVNIFTLFLDFLNNYFNFILFKLRTTTMTTTSTTTTTRNAARFIGISKGVVAK